MNNTFYGQTSYGINVNNSEMAIAVNNIFALAPGAVGLQVTTAGSYLYNDYNCFIETDGTPLTVGIHAGGTAPVIGPHSIEVDPLFTDPDNNDFSLRPGSLCRKTGKPTVGAV